MATRKRIRAPGSTETGRVLILYEQTQNDIRGIHEAMSANTATLTRKIDEGLGEVRLRLEAVEVAVRINSADIRKNSEDIRKNSEDIRKNSEDIRKNSADICKNSDDIEKLRRQVEGLTHVVEGKADERALTSLEARVARLE